MHMHMRWREAMQQSLYGPQGFFTAGAGPAAHFRTSVHASPLFAGAIAQLLGQVDAALGQPANLDLVDVGAGQGELLVALAQAVPPPLATRLRLHAVELAQRPANLPEAVNWVNAPPPGTTGLLIATEWLDNVPLDLARAGRYVLTDDSLGPTLTTEDAEWQRRWWPDAGPQDVVEIGLPRDRAWAMAVSTMDSGVAVAVDYGHLRDARPRLGTLTGFRAGRQVAPEPDGSCDLTAHVAFDSLGAGTLLTQRAALHALGVHGTRPPLALARTDPAGYLRELSRASAAAELTDPAGLGGHYWLLQPVGIGLPLLTAG